MSRIDQAEAARLLDDLVEQERRLRFTRFDEDVAWQLGNRMVAVARERSLPVVVSVRRNGQRLFHVALTGTCADNDAWIDRKSRVVDRFGKSSFRVGIECLAKGRTFEETFRVDPDTYAAHGGAFPVVVQGVGLVGTVAVSGLPQAQDHAFVVELLAEHLQVVVR